MKSKHNGYTVSAKGASATIYLYSPIGRYWDGITPKQFASDLAGLGSVNNINLRINSDGGNVFDGFTIYNLLSNHPANIEVDVDGLAASISSVIAMSAAPGKLRIAANATMMVHPPWSIAGGNADDLRKEADLLEKLDGQILNTYLTRSDTTDSVIRSLMDEETWMTADEAVGFGLADSITNEMAVAAHVDSRHRYHNMPSGFAANAPKNTSSTTLSLVRSREILRRRGLS